MQNSILLENVNSDGLKEIITEAVKNAFADVTLENKFISRQEAANKFGVSLPTLDKNLDNGTLKGYRIGGRILLKENELKLPSIKRR